MRLTGWSLFISVVDAERVLTIRHRCGWETYCNVDIDEGNLHFNLEQVINHVC